MSLCVCVVPSTSLFVAIAIEAFNKLVVSDSEHGPPPLTRSVSEPPPQPLGKVRQIPGRGTGPYLG